MEALRKERPEETPLPDFIFRSRWPEKAARAYRAAQRHPLHMEALNSYCGYGATLWDCFVRGRVGFWVEWNEHAASCPRCLDAAIEAGEFAEQGVTIEAIQRGIAAKYELPRPHPLRILAKHPLRYAAAGAGLVGLAYTSGRLADAESFVGSRVRALPQIFALAVGPAVIATAAQNFLGHLSEDFSIDEMWIPALVAPVAGLTYPIAMLLGKRGRNWRAAANVAVFALGAAGAWFHYRERSKRLQGGAYLKKRAIDPPPGAPLAYSAIALIGLLGMNNGVKVAEEAPKTRQE